MPRTLTARNIATLPAPATGSTTRQLDYWDSVEEGLALRVSPTHRGWIVRYRVDGRRRRKALGDVSKLSLADARKKANAIKRKAGDGIDVAAVAQARREAITFGELAAEYIERHAKRRKRSWPEDQRIINTELLAKGRADWTHTKVRDLTRRQITTVIEAIADRGAPIMANRTLACVSTMLNFAIRRGHIEANPSSIIEKPGDETSRERTLDDNEVRELWAALGETSRQDEQGRRIARLNATLNDAFKTRLLTAQRGGEVFRMRWQDVDVNTAWWTIPAIHSKNKREHRVFLTEPVLTILNARRAAARSDATWVFENTRGSHIGHRGKKAAAFLSLGNAHLKIKRARGRRLAPALPGLSFAFQAHDLRRTTSTGMRRAGVSEHDLSKVLNHIDGEGDGAPRAPRATKVYDRYQCDPEKKAALETWAHELDAILNGAKPATVLPFAQVTR